MQLLPFVELRLRDQLEDSVSLCSHPGRGSTQNIPGHHPMETPLFIPPSLALQMSPAPQSEEPPLFSLDAPLPKPNEGSHRTPFPGSSQGGIRPTAHPNCTGAPCAPLAGSSPALPDCLLCSATTCSAVTTHRWSLGFKTPHLYKPLPKPPASLRVREDPTLYL